MSVATTLTFRRLHPHFVGEVGPVDLRQADDADTLARIRAGMDEFAILVFRDQPFTDDEQLAFAQRLDGRLHTKTGASALYKSRLGNEALSDISNVGEDGELLKPGDRRREYGLGNRLWHTDASFQDPPGRYSMLLGPGRALRSRPTRSTPTCAPPTTRCPRRRRPGSRGSTRITRSRTRARRSASSSREAEQEKLKGAVHPLVRTIPRSGRRSLYVASHASRIVEWPVPEGRLLLRDLIEHATRPEFVYRHAWRVGDFVIWDNRATMHRALPFDDSRYRRELRRVTTLDVESHR